MCPIGFLMLGSTLQDPPSDSPAACRSACRRRQASPRTGSHQRTILACTRPILVGHAVELATAQPPPDDDGQVQTDASAGPAPLAPASSTRRRLRQTTSRSWTQRATTPTLAIPAIRRPAHAALQDLTSAGHSARGNAQTPDAGHLDAQTPAPDTGHPDRPPVGHRTLAPDTGHRMPDTGCRTRTPTRVTTAQAASGSLGRHAERRHAETRTRVCPRTTRPLGRLAGQAAPRRTAVLG
jgi:hypothetical protein